MSLRHFGKSLLALWLGLIALAAVGLEQNQLSANVELAFLTEASAGAVSIRSTTAPAVAEAASMPADCPMNHVGGHTHRGHADCPICGAEMALAALSMPFAVTLQVIGFAPVARSPAAAVVLHETPSPLAYASRAPPPQLA